MPAVPIVSVPVVSVVVAAMRGTEAEGSLDRHILGTATGDRRAFRSLYDASRGQLFGVVLRIVRHRDQAEDVLQDVYLRIWNYAPQYRPERGAPMAWLATIARNRALDWIRRHPELVPLEELADVSALGHPAPGTLDWADTGVEARALAQCLDELAAEQRRSILLAYVRGCTHDEISASLDAPLGTVKSWIRRGLSRLKACLDR